MKRKGTGPETAKVTRDNRYKAGKKPNKDGNPLGDRDR